MSDVIFCVHAYVDLYGYVHHTYFPTDYKKYERDQLVMMVNGKNYVNKVYLKKLNKELQPKVDDYLNICKSNPMFTKQKLYGIIFDDEGNIVNNVFNKVHDNYLGYEKQSLSEILEQFEKTYMIDENKQRYIMDNGKKAIFLGSFDDYYKYSVVNGKFVAESK